MLVNGVDISMLEGWMIKINSNPSFFGKNMNRRWFKVGFVPGPGSEKKLVISYSTSKTAKDPRGWLYVEDVSGVYCRREMIEIVSPSRTLRLKGETAVEHRLWSDSLYKLCNPPPKSATAVVKTTPPAEPRRDRASRTQRESKEVDDDEDEEQDQRKRRSGRARERERERHRDQEREHSGDNRRSASRHNERHSSRRSLQSSRHDGEDSGDNRQTAFSHRVSEHEPSDNDSSDDDHDSSRPSTTSSTRSLLVAQIKSGSSFESDMTTARNMMSDSEEEDDDNYRHEKKNADPEESPREPVISSTTPVDDDSSHDELEQMNPDRMIAIQQSKHKNSEHFDSDEEHEHRAPSATKHLPVHSHIKAPISNVTADNNFAHDDWDAEEEPSHPTPTSKTSYPSAVGTGGVAADANFVHEDWDD
ncbi:hypothetical protein PHMEG_00018461 [Phytophthora megakarya]|uniref:PH domain-containing protein n=1 Tax=Phytophthora megakarya TaxID=4795 RepID=A0A225VTQ5_9STRA|nr:hypothetical protein PHMEG_00018461 [Phytophthora megakarya]